MSEAEQMRDRYEKRKQIDQSSLSYRLFDHIIRAEREEKFIRLLYKQGIDLHQAVCLEVGAGTGMNLSFFFRMGAKPENIYANELLPERLEHLKIHYPQIQLLPGDATTLNITHRFDVILISTVFSSILNKEVRKQLAEKIISLLNDNGVILWYDFVYDNPNNADVKAVTLSEVRELFKPMRVVEKYKVTLLPPLGRKFVNQYQLLNNIFPILRTHVAALISR